MVLKHSGMIAIVMETTEAQNKEVSPLLGAGATLRQMLAGEVSIESIRIQVSCNTRSQLNKTSTEVGQAVP